MQLHQKAVTEFQQLAKDELGLDFAIEEAREYAEDFLTVFAVMCRPIPKDLSPPLKDKGPPSEGRP